MDLEDELLPGLVGNDENVGLFADADLVAYGIDGVVFLVGVEGEVVQPAVREAVAIV
jgi:hypothetical protein